MNPGPSVAKVTFGKDGFGNISSGMNGIFTGIWITCIGTR
jgi:hypothetical protein